MVIQDTVKHIEEHKCLQQCILLFKTFLWTSLVVQWLGIHLAMHRKWVRSLVQEDSTCCGSALAGSFFTPGTPKESGSF